MAHRQQRVAQEEGPSPWQRSAVGDGEAPLGERRHEDLSDIVELVPSSTVRPRRRGRARQRWGSGGRQAREEGSGSERRR
jgi:hypothetical protein